LPVPPPPPPSNFSEIKFRGKGFSTYDAMNMLVKAARFGLVKRIRRTYAASSNKNPVGSLRPAYFDVFLMNFKVVSYPT
jgi:hypothetical protein